MPRNVLLKVLLLSVCVVLLASFMGCQTDGVNTRALAQPLPPAPAYTLHYYPQVGVYHDLERSLFFYQEGDVWKVVEHFPYDPLTAGDFLEVDLRVGAPAAFDPARQKLVSLEAEPGVVVVRIDRMSEE
ncbi:MAG: hypothetical protein Kow0099_24760 [Candidatus Abyssubacteria bacterium]